MADRSRGLPPSYGLDVPQSVVEGPVQLGDYLEEEESAPARQSPLKPREGGRATEVPAAVQREPVTSSVVRSDQPTQQRQLRPVPRPTRLTTTVPRKQVNMTPETIRMVDELLDFVRTYSVQNDVKASELFHGLVLALYEARERLDLSSVQPRGRWGTPTAAALPIAIKNAIQSAITDWYTFNQP